MKRRLGKRIADMDAFGAPIKLNFRGDQNFKTKRGGIITCLIFTCTFWLVWIQLTQFYTLEDPNYSAYETSWLADKPVNLQ